MKSATLTIAAALVTGLGTFGFFTDTASAGVIEYTWSASQGTAQMGDTVTMTLNASIDHQQPVFEGLAAAIFNVTINDVMGGGAISSNMVHPSFAGLGTPGTITPMGISAVEATQLPGMFNPGVNLDTNIALYSFDYTITDADPRQVIFGIDSISALVYDGMSGGIPLQPITHDFALNVAAVPAPGALALLGLAGLTGLRRRRK